MKYLAIFYVLEFVLYFQFGMHCFCDNSVVQVMLKRDVPLDEIS